jgi:excisionase family DNA binding protein
MAKMFYTMQEAAEQLGVSEDRLKEMVENGDLQQFRDRDKVMFKRDQVDGLAGGGSGEAQSESQSQPDVGVSPADSGGDVVDLGADEGGGDENASSATAIPLADTGSGQSSAGGQTGGGSSQSGVDVFQSGEVEGADPAARTQVDSGQTNSESGEMSLESAGSGSGLLDLTRESDDTSLGAELLDEIYPGEGEQQQSGQDAAADTGGAGQTGGGSAMLEGMGDTGTGEAQESGAPAPAMQAIGESAEAQPAAAPAPVAAEAYDPAGSGLGAGFLAGSTVALVVGLIVAISAITGNPSGLTEAMTGSSMQFGLWMVGLLIIAVVLGLIGMAIGNAAASPGQRRSR